METRTAAPASEVPESREAGRTLTAPAQRRTGRIWGTARSELATPHGLRAAGREPAGAGAGAGAGGRGRRAVWGPGRAVLTAVGDEQAGQDHERPKS